jgi:hypothetical protein
MGLLSMPSVHLYYISKQLILRIVTMISEVLNKRHQGFIEVLAITCRFQCGLQHATIEGLCFLCVVCVGIRENTGMGIDFTLSSEVPGEQQRGQKN